MSDQQNIQRPSPLVLFSYPVVGFQMLIIAFGALVLVPILTGLDPNIALFTAGVGTLIFHFLTGMQVPIFLASSFAFIAPIIYSTQKWGVPATMSGLMVAGSVYILLSIFVQIKGYRIVRKILPNIVIGPVIISIGLSLAPVAVNLALGKSATGEEVLVDQTTACIIALISFVVTVTTALLDKEWGRLLSILYGIIAGYIAGLLFGVIHFNEVLSANWLAMHNFVEPEFHIEAIFFMLPVAIAPAIEHIGDILTISKVTKTDYLKKPGLGLTLLGDGIATSTAAFLGGPPNTTYSEVTGAVALTKVYSAHVMVWAALFAIVISFCGKLGALLSTIPTPAMGGILVILFGSIASVGIQTLISSREDLTHSRSLIIVSVILVLGIGNMHVNFGGYNIGGVGLAGLVGIILNLILPRSKPASEENQTSHSVENKENDQSSE